MNKTKTYYQPCRYIADDNIVCYSNIPEELMSFQAFASKKECEEWLENYGYDTCDYAIIAYSEDDIEEVTIIDSYGNIVEINEDDDDIKEILSSYHEAELENMPTSSRADALAFYAEKFAKYIENILD